MMSMVGGRGSSSRATQAAVAGFVFIAATAYLFSWSLQNSLPSVWVIFLIVPVLAGISVPVIVRVGGNDAVDLRAIAVLGLAFKMAASILRYLVAIVVYDGIADANTYHTYGELTILAIQRGEQSWWSLIPRGTSTDFMKQFTALIYGVIGTSRFGAFIVYAWIGYVGLWFFHRAVVRACPEVDQRRYALFLFFLPSLLFWPASIGKESLMMFGIGLTTYGVARVMTHAPGGWVCTLLGLFAGGVVRPHVSATLLVAIGFAIGTRRTRKPGKEAGISTRLITLLLIVLAVTFMFSRMVDYFFPNGGVSGVEAVTSTLERASTQTSGGNSSFDAASPSDPLSYPMGMVSVLFRPFIFEAKNTQMLIASLETAVMLVIVARNWRRFALAVRSVFDRPFMMFCVAYTTIFTIAWSSFANAGALARQRTQVWPAFLVMLALNPRFRIGPTRQPTTGTGASDTAARKGAVLPATTRPGPRLRTGRPDQPAPVPPTRPAYKPLISAEAKRTSKQSRAR